MKVSVPATCHRVPGKQGLRPESLGTETYNCAWLFQCQEIGIEILVKDKNQWFKRKKNNKYTHNHLYLSTVEYITYKSIAGSQSWFQSVR